MHHTLLGGWAITRFSASITLGSTEGSSSCMDQHTLSSAVSLNHAEFRRLARKAVKHGIG